MKISRKGVLEIAEHEGIVLGPYKDSVGVWTYGVGHTRMAGGLDPAKMAKPDTRQWTDGRVYEEMLKALRVFDDDLDSYEARVSKAIHPRISQHQFDALVSWDFNTGGATWRSKSGKEASLIRQVNSGDYTGKGFMGWLRPKEITKRRKAEMNLFRTGNYDANGDSIPVYDTISGGRTRYRTAISGKKLAEMMRLAGAKRTPVIATGGLWSQFRSWFR